MTPMIADIQRAVCQHFGISKAELLSDARRREIARPRQICCYLAREMTPRSYSEIARRMKRDHSTVIYAARTIRALWWQRQTVYRDVNVIRRRIFEEVEQREREIADLLNFPQGIGPKYSNAAFVSGPTRHIMVGQ